MNKRKVILIEYKYESFEEYIQLNYLEMIKDSLQDFLEKVEQQENTEENVKRKILINSINVLTVVFTKSLIDNVEFKLYFKAAYNIIDELNELPIKLETKEQSFVCPMKGSFRKGFKEKDDIEITEETEEIYSSGLVPIISNEKMDGFATKFLKTYYPEALEKPTRLDLKKVLEKLDVKLYLAPLEDKVLGITYFADDNVNVFTENGEVIEAKVNPGTILINYKKHSERNEGVFRNTVIHECVHWVFHRNYFELRQCLDNELTCYVCRKGNVRYENRDIEWMEWQARSLAPRILMPKKMALQKFTELTKEVDEEAKLVQMSWPEKWHRLVIKFADFFGVSKQSAKIRLIELGKTRAEGVENYIDGEYVKPFYFKSTALKKNQSFLINSEGLSHLLTSNIFVQNALKEEKLLYINKMLVVNNPKYVKYETYELTDYALEHADECCLIFDVTRYGVNKYGIVDKFSYLFSAGSNRKEKKEVNTKQANSVIARATVGASHFEKHKHLLPSDFPGTFGYHYEKGKENNVFTSFEDLAFESDVSEKTIRSYKSGKTSPSRINIIKLGLAMQLSAPYIIDMLEKADCTMTLNNGVNNILWTIIYGFQRVGLERTYIELEKVGKADILQVSDKYLKEHFLN